MLIISFAWTTPALLATENGKDVKVCTRRNWPESYARLFKAGRQVQGYDKGARVGGRPVAIISLTRDAYPERTSCAPDADYENEGLGWMERHGLLVGGVHPRDFWEQWKARDELVYVVRFQLMKRLVPLALYLPEER